MYILNANSYHKPYVDIFHTYYYYSINFLSLTCVRINLRDCYYYCVSFITLLLFAFALHSGLHTDIKLKYTI